MGTWTCTLLVLKSDMVLTHQLTQILMLKHGMKRHRDDARDGRAASSEFGTSLVNSSRSRSHFGLNQELASSKTQVKELTKDKEESEERRRKEIEDLLTSMQEKYCRDMEDCKEKRWRDDGNVWSTI